MAEQRTKRPRGPMGGPGRGMMPGEKPKDFKTSIGKLLFSFPQLSTSTLPLL